MMIVADDLKHKKKKYKRIGFLISLDMYKFLKRSNVNMTELFRRAVKSIGYDKEE